MAETDFIGKPIPRREDRRLVRGQGRYTADVMVENPLHVAFVRSPHAHARVLSIDADAARSSAGVVAVLTGADYVADGGRPVEHAPSPIDNVDPKKKAFDPAQGALILDLPQQPIGAERIRYVGEIVAVVVAETAGAARDAVEQIAVDYEPLPVVVDGRDALEPGAPQLWDQAPGNVCLDATFGDAAAVDHAFADAALVVERAFANQRLFAAFMEPRAAVAVYDAQRGGLTFFSGGQGVLRYRTELAAALGLERAQVDVVAPDVGGAFGSRSHIGPEGVLTAWAALRLRCAVRWNGDRSEGFLTDFQGRDITVHAALALAGDGTILALRSTAICNIGAYTVSYSSPHNFHRISPSTYRVPAAQVRILGVLTNTVPTNSYRGAGRPEATYAIERLLDIAAGRLGLDRVEIRRRNLVRREMLPYRTVTGLTYDSGDFVGNMERALALADWDSFASRRAQSRAHGRLRGIGVANYIESPVGNPRERTIVTVRDDAVEVVIGTQSSGQGHETVYAQVVGSYLGVPLERIRILAGDTRIVGVGGGTQSNRSMRLGGTLLVECCLEIVARARAALAAFHRVPLEAVDFREGCFATAGAAAVDIFAVATLAELTATADIDGRIPAFPTGCAVCELEVDPQTGIVTVLRYSQVDDVGQAINPLIVHGQTHGGIAQGVGQALWEELALDRTSGQLLGGSFMDYPVARASQLPRLDVDLTEDPTPGNPLRVKGAGEGGVTPAPAAVIGALVDALRDYGIEHIETPASAPKVWAALRAASAPSASSQRPPPTSRTAPVT